MVAVRVWRDYVLPTQADLKETTMPSTNPAPVKTAAAPAPFMALSPIVRGNGPPDAMAMSVLLGQLERVL
jgi:hypothetical protein